MQHNHRLTNHPFNHQLNFDVGWCNLPLDHLLDDSVDEMIECQFFSDDNKAFDES